MTAGLLRIVLLSIFLLLSSSGVCGGFSIGDFLGLNDDDDDDEEFPGQLQMKMIKENGYPAENHEVTTGDGYILTIQRIPNPNGTSILIAPGYACNSAVYLIHKKKSLAYMLYLAGYDVWLLNYRGSPSSRRHETLDPNGPDFWDFSWDEIAKWDMPANIDYVLKVTKKEFLYYLGHSMGTTIALVLLNEHPEYSRKIKLMAFLAPAVYYKHTRSPLRWLSGLNGIIMKIVRFTGKYHTWEKDSWARKLLHFLCKKLALIYQESCPFIALKVAGYNDDQTDTKSLAEATSYLPHQNSILPLLHYSEQIESGRFGAINRGPVWNQKHYNSTKPKDYSLKIGNLTKIIIYCAAGDYLVDPKDVKTLTARLNENGEVVVEVYEDPDLNYNHVDYVLYEKSEKLYKKIVNDFKKYGKRINN